MAYMSQERKAKLAPHIKLVLKRYGIKATIAVHNHSTLVLNIKSGKINFGKDWQGTRPWDGHCDVNVYHTAMFFKGKSHRFLTEVLEAMNIGNHDRSDMQSDYHDVGWYVDINIGNWNAAYKVTNG